MILRCENCAKDVETLLITGDIAYPHRQDLYNLYFWQCPQCKSFVGTHKNSKHHAPLGTIPSQELKQARIKAHFFIDRLWKEKIFTRKQVYKLLSEYMSFAYHNGTTRNVEECEKAIAYAKYLYTNQKDITNEQCPHYDSILGTCDLYTIEKDMFDCREEVNAKCKDIRKCEYKGKRNEQTRTD